MSEELANVLLGQNAWLVDEMYEQYRANPNSVSASWQEFFADYGNDKSEVITGAAKERLAAPAAPAAPPITDAAAASAAPTPAAEAPGDPIRGAAARIVASIPVETVEQMRSACEAAGKTCEIIIYPDAPHAFHADYRPSYRPEPAKDGWSRMLAWFRKHGVA